MHHSTPVTVLPCHSHWWQVLAALQVNDLSLVQMVMELVLEN